MDWIEGYLLWVFAAFPIGGVIGFIAAKAGFAFPPGALAPEAWRCALSAGFLASQIVAALGLIDRACAVLALLV